MIHPTALVHPGADLDASVEVGPYSVIGEGVTLGAGCELGPHCHFIGRAIIGAGNRFHAGCVIGDAPQDLKYRNEPTGLRIGDDNIFREHFTVHRSNNPEEDTVLGSGGFYMANSHVGHNCRIGDRIILANGALLSGHVEVRDRAFVSGNCLVHQFVRVGMLALMQGGSRISKDLPPFTVARGGNRICGLNTIGLRRAGYTPAERVELKRLYRLFFRSGLALAEALQQAGHPPANSPAGIFVGFAAGTRRGLCIDSSLRADDEADADTS